MIKVIIISQNGKIKARELNHLYKPTEPELPYQPFYAPYGMSDEEFRHEQHIASELASDVMNTYYEELNIWQSAEDKLRTWEIEYPECDCEEIHHGNLCFVKCKEYTFELGSIHSCEIINDSTVRILD